jgi:thiamine-phosphate diphosphorylase
MLVTDRRRCGSKGLRACIEAAVRAGVDAVQLREKDLPARELYALALEVRALTSGRCAMIVNERLDVALASGADGVHLPENGLPAAAARELCPPGFLVGCSVHSAEAAASAQAAGASYIELGTIFETASKPGLTPAGLDLVRSATAGLKIPCIAIGGIDSGNAASVLEAGASGVAVVAAILQAADIDGAVRDLRHALVTPFLPSATALESGT